MDVSSKRGVPQHFDPSSKVLIGNPPISISIAIHFTFTSSFFRYARTHTLAISLVRHKKKANDNKENFNA